MELTKDHLIACAGKIVYSIKIIGTTITVDEIAQLPFGPLLMKPIDATACLAIGHTKNYVITPYQKDDGNACELLWKHTAHLVMKFVCLMPGFDFQGYPLAVRIIE